MKRLVPAVIVVVALMVLVADIALARVQGDRFARRVGGDDPFVALVAQIQTGMSRAEVEKLLSGYRAAEIQKHDDGSMSVDYGYWFGFLPLIRGKYALKYWGEIDVSYSPEGRVLDSGYWYN